MKKRLHISVLEFMRAEKGQLFALFALVAAGIVFFILIAYRFRYSLGVDGISYISIAQQYADGLLSTAINAYWSPMMSWLMTPLVAVGIDGSVAFLAINVVSASFFLAYGTYMVWRIAERKFTPALLFVLVSFPLLYDAIRIFTPDLLVLTWMLVLIATSIKIMQTQQLKARNWRWMIAIGAIGALGYFVKLYLVPVFIVFLALWGAVCLNAQKSKKSRAMILKFFAFSFLFFGLFSLPWAASLSIKYKTLTFGSSASVNMSSKFTDTGKVVQIDQLDEPPHERAVAYGEDRTVEVATNEVLSSSSTKEKLLYYAEGRLQALPYYLNRISSLWPFTLFIIAVVGAALLLGRLRWRHRDYPSVLVYLFMFVYGVGYAAIAGMNTGGGNVRYYWPVMLAALLLACCLLHRSRQQVWRAGGLLRKLAFTLLIVCMIITPYLHYIGGIRYFGSVPVLNPVGIAPSERVITPHPFERVQSPPIRDLAERIKDDGQVPRGSRLVGDDYRMTMYLAYYLKSQVFGRSQKGNYYNLKEPNKTLDNLGIDYVIQFTPEGEQRRGYVKGDIIAEYDYTGSCRDKRAAIAEACSVVIVEKK